MMQQYMKELEQEPFDPEEFVERLAWRTVNDKTKDGSKAFFNPVIVHETFLQAIKDLQILEERQQKKCDKLEAALKDEEARHALEILDLQERNKHSIDLFHQLDERINSVATKVLHLGDQLESVNIPRARAVEAQKLMRYFSEFLSPGPLTDTIFTDKTSLDEAADVIQKLHLIAQELPAAKFEHAKKKIGIKYDEIERNLIEEFVQSHSREDAVRMKELASVLSQFKGYSQCIDAFIEQSQMGSFGGKDVFQDVIPMCTKYNKLMEQVFSNPEQVMAKFVLNIYHLRLQKYAVAKLADKTDSDKYLKNLHDLYGRTVKLSNELKIFNMGTDDSYLKKLTRNIFQKYLDTYITTEMKALREKSATLLIEYYESKNHQKKQLQTSSFQELRRDLQAALAARTNINIAQIEDYGGETFLSEELAIALLQRSKMAFQRCQLLSQPNDLSVNVVQIFEILLQYLINEHVDYALELGLQSVPIPESRTQPEIHFFNVMHQCNAIVRLLEEQFNDSVLPLIIGTAKHGDCVLKKKVLLDQINMKLDTGLERSISAIVGWVKIYLQNEQKKTDFKPDTDVDTLSTPACLTVVQYVTGMIRQIRNTLDGKNLETALTELGVRFHKVIYDHLQQFQFNSAGAMCVICDMNEYRKCVKELDVDAVTSSFDTLHALCNLLLVKPENLKQVCSGDQLAVLDRSVLLNFIQLRTDYKTQKLANCLKGLAT
ncbi:PREDICTED: exocyst complex component 5 [Polistes dominula]|uniref:Exocyst complex component 5 n=1 Tax=Polistes dominula TaxID=743375 RepID=A0ABM1IZV7_POLDO|nr:PREDICTED: exocyst complex component 5 [Polistes dominula]XP_015185743.1 PREDICTED: exocyst complex component 5 [Polistes dominula]XP_015185744.1 PREDICTED: exocyst complex component 5 [Polistes dominula]